MQELLDVRLVHIEQVNERIRLLKLSLAFPIKVHHIDLSYPLLKAQH